MRTNYVLIDYENTQPKSFSELQQYHFQIMVFVGANQTKIDTDLVQELLALSPRAALVKIAGNGRNALDFHIAFYIGSLSAVDQNAFFHIISNDTGFDPLIAHLKAKKIYCARSRDIGDMPIVKTTKSKTSQEKADLAAERIETRSVSRPRTVKTLLSTINSWFQKELTDADQQQILAALVKKGVVSVDGNKVSYPQPAHT